MMMMMMMRARMIQPNEGTKMQTSHLWNRKFQQSLGMGGFEITSIDLNQNSESKLEYLSKPSPTNRPRSFLMETIQTEKSNSAAFLPQH